MRPHPTFSSKNFSLLLHKSRQICRLHDIWHKLRCCRKLLQFASKILFFFLWFIAFAFPWCRILFFLINTKFDRLLFWNVKCKRLVLKVLFWAALLWYTGPWGNIKPHIFLTFNMKQSQIWKVSTVSSRAACIWYLGGSIWHLGSVYLVFAKSKVKQQALD